MTAALRGQAESNPDANMSAATGVRRARVHNDVKGIFYQRDERQWR